MGGRAGGKVAATGAVDKAAATTTEVRFRV
jgi:hypothetical protein